MAQAAAVNSPSQSALRPPRRRIRWKIWIPTVALTGAAAYIAIIAMNWPFTQRAVIDVLQQRSLRAVTIGRFDRTYFPPGCIAEDVRFLHRKHKEKPPLITVRKLVLATNYPSSKI
jgi:hypothetical protein